MKRRVPPGLLPRWKWMATGLLFMGLGVMLVVFLKMQQQTLKLVHHHQLHHSPEFSFLPKSSRQRGENSSKNDGNSDKLAFLFIARHSIPLDILWEHFFLESQKHKYSVYIHARPGYVYTTENTQCRSFLNRQLKNSVQVEWGEASMVEAERLLLAEALQDPLNQRFILLSDSCIPLYNFDYTYNYVMSSPKSFVDSFLHTRDDQYNPKMRNVVLREKWRKGSQWFVLIRSHAQAVVSDSSVFAIFQKHCRKMLLPENWREIASTNKTHENHNCIPDEHYIQTLIAVKNKEAEIERRTLTYSQWEQTKKDKGGRRGWHPMTFNFAAATVETIRAIQDIYKIHYEAEARTDLCSLEGEAMPCYLFARKFNRAAGFRLLDQVASYENRV
jgi:hypothetical protein